jgi:hypothetical protein
MPLADTKLSKTASEPGAEAPNPPQPLNGLKQPHRGNDQGVELLELVTPHELTSRGREGELPCLPQRDRNTRRTDFARQATREEILRILRRANDRGHRSSKQARRTRRNHSAATVANKLLARSNLPAPPPKPPDSRSAGAARSPGRRNPVSASRLSFSQA